MRLMCRVGTRAAAWADGQLQNLDCKRIEVDEIWAFVSKKNRNVRESDDWTQVGDQYTFVALDPETKLIPSYLVGKRTAWTAIEFMEDLAGRLRNRVQISSDGFSPYFHAVEHAFGRGNVDYGIVVKEYAETEAGRGRYSPARIVQVEKDDVMGFPNMETVSTSLVERQNLTIRTHCRRLTRLSLGFSKKLENLKASMDLYFTFYNFVKNHRSIRCTPAMEAGVAKSPLTVADLVDIAA